MLVPALRTRLRALTPAAPLHVCPQLLAGLATGSAARAECLKMGGGKAGCRPTKKGYVTVNQGKDGMACIHTPNGAGICWPGGKTGYNKSIQVHLICSRTRAAQRASRASASAALPALPALPLRAGPAEWCRW